MAEDSSWTRLWNYTAECARLLYWAFFKPYTLRRWLREIDPELADDSNPFKMRDKWPANPRLRRYAGQLWLTVAVFPLLCTLIVGLLYPLLAHDTFNWWRSGQAVLAGG